MGTITIAEIRQKPKRSVIFTTDGKQYGCWTDKLGKLGLEQGASYNVETDSFETDNGTTLFNIISAKRVTLGASTAAPQPQGQPAPASGPAAAGAAFRTPEQLSVTEIICAYINSGRCDPAKLGEVIGYVRAAWHKHYGDEEPYRQAAE